MPFDFEVRDTSSLPSRSTSEGDDAQPTLFESEASGGTEKPSAAEAENAASGVGDINVEAELWESAVSLRGTVAPSDYKHYVLPLLFIRYLSLRYDRRYEELKAVTKDPASPYYTDDEAMREDILEDPDEYTRKNVFVVPEEAQWSYIVKSAQDDDIKLKLDRAMEALEAAYPELQGVLPKIYARSNLSRENVASLINVFARDVFAAEAGRESDVLGRVYEYFITHFASTEGNRGGEFFTPRSIVKLLVEMLEPEEGIVFDPSCGSGGMFVQSARFTERGRALSFYGQERVDTTLRLGKMNLLMHGLNGDIKLGNSLLDDQHPGLLADVVIANPPFNVSQWGASKVSKQDPRLKIGEARITPTDSNANYFWMAHFLHHLKEGGTAGFVMANGAMTTSTTVEREAREALVEAGLVDCIVQLPTKLFFGTQIPATLWFLSKSRGGTHDHRKRKDEILFIDAREKGELISRKQRVLPEEEIREIAALYHHYRNAGDNPEDVPGFCCVVPLADVREHGYKLTPGIYVGTEAEEEDDEPYEEKMPRLVEELNGHFAEAERLRERITANLSGLLDGIDG